MMKELAWFIVWLKIFFGKTVGISHTHTQMAMICSSSFFCFLQKFVYNENWPSWFLCNLVVFCICIHTHIAFLLWFCFFLKNKLPSNRQTILSSKKHHHSITYKHEYLLQIFTMSETKNIYNIQTDRQIFFWQFLTPSLHPSIHPSIESNKLMTLN